MPLLAPVITTPFPASPRSIASSSVRARQQRFERGPVDRRLCGERAQQELAPRRVLAPAKLRDRRGQLLLVGTLGLVALEHTLLVLQSEPVEQLTQELRVVLEEILGEQLLGDGGKRAARQRLSHPLRLALARLPAQEHRAQAECAGRSRERDLLDARRLAVNLVQKSERSVGTHRGEDLVGTHRAPS